MKYHHVVGQWEVPSSEEKSTATLLLFDNIILMAEGSQLAVIDEESEQVAHRKLSFASKGMVHPVSYVNKVLVWGSKHLCLMNPLSDKVLYEYPKTLSLLEEQ